MPRAPRSWRRTTPFKCCRRAPKNSCAHASPIAKILPDLRSTTSQKTSHGSATKFFRILRRPLTPAPKTGCWCDPRAAAPSILNSPLAKRRSTDNLSEHRAPSAARDAAIRSRRSSWLTLSSFLRSSLMSLVRITLPLALLLALVGCKKKNIEEAVTAKQEQHEEPPHERAPSA